MNHTLNLGQINGPRNSEDSWQGDLHSWPSLQVVPNCPHVISSLLHQTQPDGPKASSHTATARMELIKKWHSTNWTLCHLPYSQHWKESALGKGRKGFFIKQESPKIKQKEKEKRVLETLIPSSRRKLGTTTGTSCPSPHDILRPRLEIKPRNWYHFPNFDKNTLPTSSGTLRDVVNHVEVRN